MRPNKNKSKNVYGLYNLAIITLKKVEKQNRELRAKLKEEEDRADSRFTEALKEQAKEIMKDVKYKMLMIWEGTITKTDLGAIELHTKIMDDMREKFNEIYRKWVGKE